MKCIGMTCGAGTFLVGAQKHFKVLLNFDHSGFGEDTCSEVFNIPTAAASADYTEIPYLDTDCVFANAGTWLEAQKALKYTIGNSIPICVLDIRTKLWLSYESYFYEVSKAAAAAGYRSVYLFYTTLSFDTGFREGRLALVIHDKHKNFNITVPHLPEISRHVQNYMGEIIYRTTAEIRPRETEYELHSHYELEYDEKICLPRLEKGWSLRQFAKHKMRMVPGTARAFAKEIVDNVNYVDIHRPHWEFKLTTSDIRHCRHCHPDLNRLLTIGEMMRIVEWTRPPKGLHPIEQMMHGTPAVIGEWLALQAKLWVQDNWKKQDYEISYSSKEGKFKGGDANPLRPKKFIDITEYFNEVYDRLEKRAVDRIGEDDLIEF